MPKSPVLTANELCIGRA